MNNIIENEEIHGWFDFEQWYEHISKQFEPNSIYVEVGVWMGKSLSYLTERLIANQKEPIIVAVDTFKGSDNEPRQQELIREYGGNLYEIFIKNLKEQGIREQVLVIPQDSVTAASNFYDESVEFVFIDANHSYESVKSDINAWLPKIKVGGILSGHDYDHNGVRKAVEELLPKAEGYEGGGHVWFFTKVS